VSPQTTDEKAQATLDFVGQFSEFSLRKFLEAVFISESGNIKSFSKKFVSEGSLSWNYGYLVDNIWRFIESHIHRVGGGKAASACVEEV